jgi:hypothetical protein
VAAVAQAGQHLGLDVDRARRQQNTPRHPSPRVLRLGKPESALLATVLMEFGDFAMMRRMLRGIKKRAEALHRQNR